MFLCNDHRVASLWCSWSSLEGVGPVDEVEVQVLQLQVLQGLQEGRLHVLWVMFSVPQLGCDEHILSSQRLMNTHHMHRIKVHAGLLTVKQTGLLLKQCRASPCPGRGLPAGPLRSPPRWRRWRRNQCGDIRLPKPKWLLVSPVDRDTKGQLYEKTNDSKLCLSFGTEICWYFMLFETPKTALVGTWCVMCTFTLVAARVVLIRNSPYALIYSALNIATVRTLAHILLAILPYYL